MNPLERIGLEAYRALYRDRAVEVAPGVVSLCAPEAPGSPMLNRVVGLGVDRPATEEDVDAAIDAMGDAVFYVAVSPEAGPEELPTWLAARGLEPGWGWMQFERGPEEPPPVQTELDLRETGPERVDAFARIQRIAYGLSEAAERWLRTAFGTPGWTFWLGFADGEPATAAGLYVEGDVCYLGLAATLPEHRGKGGQGAMLATRIERARELGCTLLVTETGEQRPDRPSSSYRNLLRFGFRESHAVANWLRKPSS